MEQVNHIGSLKERSSSRKKERLPALLVYSLLLVCFLPLILNLFGIRFEIADFTFDWNSISPDDRSEVMFVALRGSFVHTVLEWTAVCIATVTAALAFLHFSLKKDPTVPILGMALFASGCMDAFHTLATDRIFQSVIANNQNLIPFTWAISRIFNASIKVAGVFLFLAMPRFFGKRELNLKAVFSISVLFASASLAVITYCAHSRSLPAVMFPNSWIARPYDLVSLSIYLLGGGLLLRYYKMGPSYFAHALLIGLIPDILTQALMAFGSRTLYDNYFNIAHFTKIVSYFIPFCGLCLDYMATYKEEREAQQLLLQAGKMSALGEMAGGIAHEINNPLAIIQTISGQIQEIIEEDPLDRELVKKMAMTVESTTVKIAKIVKGLKSFSRDGSRDSFQEVNLYQMLQETLELCRERFRIHGIQLIVENYDHDLCVNGRSVEISQVLLNLLNNAHDAILGLDEKWIRLSMESKDEWTEVRVTDSGRGIPENIQEKIFQPFFTTKEIGKGTGLGLSISVGIIQSHHGELSIDRQCSNTSFVIRLPKHRTAASQITAA